MTRLRLLLNLLVGLVLAVILAGLCAIIVIERCERNVKPGRAMVQVDFEPGAHRAMREGR